VCREDRLALEVNENGEPNNTFLQPPMTAMTGLVKGVL
jgi:hypothetical protein